jgi:hypothetical protein
MICRIAMVRSSSDTDTMTAKEPAGKKLINDKITKIRAKQ